MVNKSSNAAGLSENISNDEVSRRHVKEGPQRFVQFKESVEATRAKRLDRDVHLENVKQSCNFFVI